MFIMGYVTIINLVVYWYNKYFKMMFYKHMANRVNEEV